MLGIWNVQVFTPGTASVQIGQEKARAELNFDGLINSDQLDEVINKRTQLNGYPLTKQPSSPAKSSLVGRAKSAP